LNGPQIYIYKNNLKSLPCLLFLKLISVNSPFFAGMENSFFKDKVVVLTGASSGIGKACAIELSKLGCKLVLAARNIDQLNELASGLSNNQVLAVKTDVSKEEDCKNLMEQALSRFGQIDILINNAGISMRALFVDLDLEVLKQLMDVNFWGTVYCTKYAMPALLKTKGTVVAISSIAGYRGLAARTGYSASKFAMNGFMEALRTENLKTGMHFLTVCPGFTASNIRNTALNAKGGMQGESPRDEAKMMSAEEVAAHISKAILHKKKTIVLTSQGKLTVLMNKFFNGWMDTMVYNHLAKEADSPLK
jgi:short-subunit dehydrogenase